MEEDTNIAAKILTNCLHEAGRFLIKKPIFKGKQPEWWDEDCSLQKSVKNSVLNQFRRTDNVGTMNNYIPEKQTFKKLCNRYNWNVLGNILQENMKTAVVEEN